MAFPKGKPNPNAGRKHGSTNRVTQDIRIAFQNLLELNTPNMIGWLERVALVDPAKALGLCADLSEFVIPKLARTENYNANADINTAEPSDVDKQILARYGIGAGKPKEK